MAWKSSRGLFFLISAFMLQIAHISVAGTIYVDANAAGANNGSSWENAYIYLQDALTAAQSDDEIWVAKGTYKPDQGYGITPGDRAVSFQLKDGVSLYGGFAGNETDVNQRDPCANETIFSGNIGQPDSNEDNSYHVVYAPNNITALIDGFTITKGKATGPYNRGGGFSAEYGSHTNLTIRRCRFVENFAQYGGGLSTEYSYSEVLIDNCSFIRNSATRCGGGIYSSGQDIITNSDFFENSANDAGGGICNSGLPYEKILNCRFGKNKSLIQYTEGYGGGAIFTDCGVAIVNCVFTGNISASRGSSIHFWASIYDTSFLINCTFTGNEWDPNSEEIYSWFDVWDLRVSNCIFQNNNNNGRIFYIGERCNLDIKFCDIQGGRSAISVDPNGFSHWCWGNIDADPNFVNAPGPDGIYGTEDDNLRLSPSSPCIDAGDNSAVPVDVNTDLSGQPRFFDDPNTHDTGSGGPPIVDMGAYEYIPNICGDTAHSYPIGDLDHNCRVDFYDFAIFTEHWIEGVTP